MKARDLIRALQGVSPDADVVIHVVTPLRVASATPERDDEGRAYVAMVCSTLPPEPEVPKLPNPERLLGDVVAPERILAVVARAYDIEPRALEGPVKTKCLTEARFVCWWLLRAHTRLSLPAIGRMFKRDHTTIHAGVKQCERQRETNRPYRDQVARLQSIILG